MLRTNRTPAEREVAYRICVRLRRRRYPPTAWYSERFDLDIDIDAEDPADGVRMITRSDHRRAVVLIDRWVPA